MANTINADNGVISGITGIRTTADNTGNLALQTNGNTVLTLNTANAAVFAGSVTANSVVSTSTINVPNTFGFKNRIINGDMRIDQRNSGANVTITTNPQYTLDRWYITDTVASKLSVQQNAGSVTPPAGFTNYLGVTSLSSYTVGASELFLLRQGIEGNNVADLAWGTANAKTITLSFWVRSSLTGTFSGTLRGASSTRFYQFSYTISSANTWEQKSFTIVGDTSGTWITDSNVGLELMFSLGTGSSFQGTAGSWSGTTAYGVTGTTSVVGTNGATFYITGVQLEVGSQATSFDFRSYPTELGMCYRYYQGQQSYYGLKTASGYTRINIALPAVMRTSPSVTFSDVVGNASRISIYYANDARTDNVGAIACAGAGVSQFQLLPNNTDSAPGYAFLASMSAEI